MFHAFKGVMKVRKLSDPESPYFPCQYLRRQMVVFMAHNRAKIWKHKEASLWGLYGVEAEGEDILSYRQYLIKLLDKATWGDDVCIHALSCLFCLKITCVNASRLDKARYHHNLPWGAVDIVLIFNGNNHYSFAGK